jgi:hypothetical protein
MEDFMRGPWSKGTARGGDMRCEDHVDGYWTAVVDLRRATRE